MSWGVCIEATFQAFTWLTWRHFKLKCKQHKNGMSEKIKKKWSCWRFNCEPNSRRTKPSYKTFKTTYIYNFEIFFNSQKKTVLRQFRFFEKCSGKNNNSTTLVMFDIKSLYTKILQNYGLKSISFSIKTHSGLIIWYIFKSICTGKYIRKY